MTTTSKTQMTEMESIPWVESPFFEELLDSSELDSDTKEKVRFFSENGYLVIDPKIEQFDQISSTIIQTLAKEQSTDSRVLDSWGYVPETKYLASCPAILKWLEILYGRQPIPFQTLNFKHGTQQATHSDLVHFNSFPQRFMAGVWFALEDVDSENGPLHYYPKSHKLPVYELHDIGLKKSSLKNRNDQYSQYEVFVQNLMNKLKFDKKTVHMKKGEALIWAANLFHGGDPIRDSSRTRHSQVTHYYFENCRYYCPLYSDVYLEDICWKEICDIRTGKKVPHKYLGSHVQVPMTQRIRYFMERQLRSNEMSRKLMQKIKKLLTSS